MRITRDIWEAEKSSIPIPVYEWSYKEYVEHEIAKGYPVNRSELSNLGGYGGVYAIYHAYPIKNRYIFIYRNCPLYVKMWMMAHEEGHYICDINKCKCMRFPKSERMGEEHATRYALKKLMAKKYYDSLYDYMREISEGIRIKIEAPYGPVYLKVANSLLWEQCYKILKKYKKGGL